MGGWRRIKSISLQFHFDFTSMTLRCHFDFTSISLRLHCGHNIWGHWTNWKIDFQTSSKTKSGDTSRKKSYGPCGPPDTLRPPQLQPELWFLWKLDFSWFTNECLVICPNFVKYQRQVIKVFWGEKDSYGQCGPPDTLRPPKLQSELCFFVKIRFLQVH